MARCVNWIGLGWMKGRVWFWMCTCDGALRQDEPREHLVGVDEALLCMDLFTYVCEDAGRDDDDDDQEQQQQ